MQRRIVDICSFETGEVQSRLARWNFRSIFFGPFDSGSTLDALSAHTIPIGDLLLATTDAFYFEASNRNLVAARIETPEKPVNDTSLLRRLKAGTPSVAIPRLKVGVSGVTPLGCDRTCVDSDGSAVIAYSGDAASVVDVHMLVAPNLGFFFGEHVHGWMLYDPAQHLVSAWEESAIEAPDARLAPLIARLVLFVRPENLDLLDENDSHAVDEVRAFNTALLDMKATPQREAVQRKVHEIADTFDVALYEPTP